MLIAHTCNFMVSSIPVRVHQTSVSSFHAPSVYILFFPSYFHLMLFVKIQNSATLTMTCTIASDKCGISFKLQISVPRFLCCFNILLLLQQHQSAFVLEQDIAPHPIALSNAKDYVLDLERSVFLFTIQSNDNCGGISRFTRG